MLKKKDKPTLLNAEQLAAVNETEGAVCLIAGPGSGKTRVLIERYKKLRATTQIHEILSLTFSKTAAAEMRARAEEKELKDPLGLRPCGFMTFHSLALGIVTQEYDQFGYHLQPFPLATPGQVTKLLGEVSRRHNVDFKTLSSRISAWKREGIRGSEAVRNADIVEANDAGDQQLALAYKEYETRMREAGVMDFDSLLMEVVDLLSRNPEIRKHYQYRYIMADEFQDTDEMQVKLLQLLSEEHGNIFAVGDQNQGIFGFRGGAGDALLNFQQHFPGAKVLYLNTNYRSTKSITTFNYKIAPYPPPEPYQSPAEEAIGVGQDVYRAFAQEGTLFYVPTKKIADVSVAVLSRTNRGLRPYEELFSKEGIKYYLLGKSGYWSQSEIANVMAYVQCAVFPTDAALQSAIRAPFHPSKYVKKKELVDFLKRWQERYPDKQLSMWQTLGSIRGGENTQDRAINGFRSFVQQLSRYREAPAEVAVQGIITDLQAARYYSEEEANPDNDPVANLMELPRIAGRFSTVPEFLDHVRKVRNASKVKKGVALGTGHASKGLQFDTVFLVNATEGILPHKKAIDIDEERRVFFVMASRAAKRLHISYSGQPSRFLKDFIPEPEAA
jgi:DNA helicase-2/ATP-dependent DNA helicase PcrA